MDFKQLEYFLHVAKTENMSISAEALGVSQSTLNMSIKRLEEELDIPLFDRINHRIYLNSCGRLFLKHAQHCLEELNEGKQEIEINMSRKNNRVTISCPVYYLTGSIFESFFKVHPTASIESRQVPYWEIEDVLLNRSVDVCITSMKPESDQLDCAVFAQRKMGILCSKNNPLSKKKTIRVTDIQDERIVCFPRTSPPRCDLEQICSSRGFEPNVVFESKSYAELINMCRNGMGLYMMSYEATVFIDMTDMAFVPFDESETDTRLCFYILTHKDNHKQLVEDLKHQIVSTL